MWKSHSASRIGTTADQRVPTTAHIGLYDLNRGTTTKLSGTFIMTFDSPFHPITVAIQTILTGSTQSISV